MTKIEYSVENNEFKIEVKGHAGYAAMGNDIVCAALSVLIQTLMLHMGDVAEEWDALANSGYAYIEGRGKDAVASFLTILTGIRAISDQYPEYVSIKWGCPIKKGLPLK